jgi:hypothetical protein
MAKKKIAKKKDGATGRKADTRAVASRQQPPAQQGPCDHGGDHEIPRPHVTLAQTDTLVAITQRLEVRMTSLEGRLSDEQPPAFAAEILDRLARLEASLHRPAEHQQADVPAPVMKLRRLFAAACKALGIVGPTPAILGRVMHDCGVFDPDNHRAPRNLFESIYAKRNTPNHLSDRIRSLLQQYGNESSPSQGQAGSPDEGVAIEQQQSLLPRKGSADIAKQIGPEFDKRFTLIEYSGYGKRERVKQGGKTSYRRYLTSSGRELFKDWPAWTDATGGIGLADEDGLPIPQPPSGPFLAGSGSVGGDDATAITG